MEILSIDFETRSRADLRRAGLHVYARDKSTEVLCMAYAFGDDEPSIWIPGPPLPSDVQYAVGAGCPVRAWNAAFEHEIWNHVLVPLAQAPTLTSEQLYDTMAEAAALALPRGLEKCASVLGLLEQKDKAGHRLMMKCSRPMRSGKFYQPTPEERQALWDYCKQDVRTERAVAKALYPLSPAERRVWLLDQKINHRGVHLDLELVAALGLIVEREAHRANERLNEITEGTTEAFTQVAALKEWLASRGVEVDSLNKERVRELLAEDHPADVIEALTLRQDLGRTSVGKLKAMIFGTLKDQRARGLLVYHAATTGRWAGARIQPQNFPRPEVKDPEQYIPAVMAGEEIDQPMAVATSLLRSCITATPGNRILCADFSQIEARVLGFLAGEPYREKEYERMAAKIYGLTLEDVAKDSDERQIGKNTVLGCGYGMGWEKYIDYVYAATGIRVEETLARTAIDTYRTDKPGVVDFWTATENAAKAAVYNRGELYTTGAGAEVRWLWPTGSPFLYCRLPSGRKLAYAKPRIVNRETPWGEMRPSLSCMGTNTYTRKWQRNTLYGGLLVENVVQATARDVMVEAMVRVERAGYPVVLTVHDEVVCDVPHRLGSLDHFLRLMEHVPTWALGLPTEVEGYEAERWRK